LADVSHADDLLYYWFTDGSGCPITPIERDAYKVKEHWLDIFTSFATHRFSSSAL
jgi:hypothetical protein